MHKIEEEHDADIQISMSFKRFNFRKSELKKLHNFNDCTNNRDSNQQKISLFLTSSCLFQQNILVRNLILFFSHYHFFFSEKYQPVKELYHHDGENILLNKKYFEKNRFLKCTENISKNHHNNFHSD